MADYDPTKKYHVVYKQDGVNVVEDADDEHEALEIAKRRDGIVMKPSREREQSKLRKLG